MNLIFIKGNRILNIVIFLICITICRTNVIRLENKKIQLREFNKTNENEYEILIKRDVTPVDPLIELDSWLAPYKDSLLKRYNLFSKWIKDLQKNEGGIDAFSKGYEKLGFNITPEGIMYREWAPNAVRAHLMGEFNNWNRNSHEMHSDKYGVWEIFLPNNSDGSNQIKHNTKVRLYLTLPNGEKVERIPAWIRRATQDTKVSTVYDGVFWNPPQKYVFKNKSPKKPSSIKIYEAHVGIASSEYKIATYKEFTKNMLPRIKDLGYNSIQLMAIMEHPYYPSYGYQVSNFFAASSRFGTPEELMELIDTAHGMGIYVILDLVHSHACGNLIEGLNKFDGTDYQYFHSGKRGDHELWGTKVFDYGKYETLRFLISNVRFWMDVYHFDGFRFDGVTSMMYKHHGLNYGFNGYNDYFNDLTDNDAIVYMMLVNYLVHEINPNTITIAEDVSGMPTLCRPISEGGIGFDYRFAMAIPDMWTRLTKETRDENWDMGNICWTMTNRRYKEKTIAYAECHDQALYGFRSLSSWLMDQEIYNNMSESKQLTSVIDRGIALHKMLRLTTHSLGGEGYLNFIGNEFGHPDYIDLPRSGNNYSYYYARRQFNLVDDKTLRYKYLNEFDKAMQTLEDEYKWLDDEQATISLKHENDKLIVFERGNLLWIYNYHPTKSYSNYRVGTKWESQHYIVLNSDSNEFGGHNRVNENNKYTPQKQERNGRPYSFQIDIPNRTAIVLAHK